MTNADMKPGRFLKMQTGRNKFRKIHEVLSRGGVVQVCTCTRATEYRGAEHLPSFVMDKAGSLYVRRGKHLDCIDYCGLRFGR